jgi:DNA polymerase-1
MPGPALLVDTYSVFFRAFHALPMMNTASGEPTNALYGFSSVLLKELREQKPAALAFAVDAPQKTFRHERFTAYKAQREALPSPLVVQLGRLRELLDAFEVPVLCVPGFEADDILATVSERLRAEGGDVLVMSGDRDLLQLAYGCVRVLFLGARGQKPVLYDEAAVEERFMVKPTQLPSYAALVGDTSDNLPGVPGVGPRTAAKWVQEFGNMSQLLERSSEVKPERLAAVLAAHQDQVRLNEQLATLHKDVPLTDSPLARGLGSNAFERLRKLFDELEFKSLSARLDALAAARGV